MKKVLIIMLIISLMTLISVGVSADSFGIGYGFFEAKEADEDVDGLILSAENDFADNYNFDFTYFMGEGDYDYESNLINMRVYKRITKNFYLGGGWKWLTEDQEYMGLAIDTSQWGVPISAKYETYLEKGVSFGAKADYWFFGEYEADSNFLPDFEGDFEGYGFDIYFRKTFEKTSIKVGYIDEDFTFGEDSSVGINEFDGGFDGFYISGEINY